MAVAFDYYYITHINRLEKVQRKFVKRICFKFNIFYDSDRYLHILSYMAKSLFIYAAHILICVCCLKFYQMLLTVLTCYLCYIFMFLATK
jgi:hypothetical protein